MPDNPPIVIDHREHADELKTILQDQYAFTVSVAQLKLGDYFLIPKIVIERKTTRDFCLSIIDGRLFRQAWRLANYHGISLMIVEGLSYTEGHEINIEINAVKGALITLAQTFRLPLLRTRNQVDSAWHIHQLYQQRRRAGNETRTLYGHTPKTADARKSHVLKSLPGVGPKIAKSLLDEFGSITKIFSASKDDLLNVRGLGPNTIEQIWHVLRESSPFYGNDTEGKKS